MSSTQLNVSPDFDYTKPESIRGCEFLHRKLADGDLYFVDNRGDHDDDDRCYVPRERQGSRNCGMRRPARSEPVSYKIADGRTTVPLHLEPWGTVFVVFRKATTEMSRESAEGS